MTYHDPDEWLTPAKAAKLLGKHEKTVRQMCADGLIERRCERNGPKGQPRYTIQRRAIDAYNRRMKEAA